MCGDRMKEKNIYIVMGILVLCLCLGGILFFSKDFKSNPKEDKVSFYSDISINDEAVLELYQNIMASDELSFNYDLLKNNVITNSYMIGSGMAKALRDNVKTPISSSEINLYIRKIFGDVTVHYEDILLNGQKYSFDSDKDEYVIKEMDDYSKTDKILSKLVSAKKSTTEYILTIKMVVVNNANNNVYSDIDSTNIIDNRENINIDDYLDEASTYNYHFTFNGETFVLTSVAK